MADDTIYALSSAPGRAALAVVRISGPAAAAALDAIAGSRPSPRKTTLRTLHHPLTGEPIDQALVLFFSAPASATGEDIAEFHVHGGRAVVQALYDALAAIDGCRPAEPGEFARRSFANGKLDLTAAEGIADLIDAETEAQRRQAQHQAGGGLAGLYDDWREQLLQAQALVEAAIDFSDEADVGEQACAGARTIAEPLRQALAAHLEGAGRGEIIRSGYRVVIAGPPNVGKSSLLNALARRDAAIVSEEAGTTRDVIEVHLDLDGLPVIVSDTAGVRETADMVEREGVRRTLDRASTADLVLWLEDATVARPPSPDDALGATEVVRVANKIDLAAAPATDATVAISAKTGVGLDALIDRIVGHAGARLGAGDQVVPTNARHRHHLAAAVAHLETFLAADMSQLELRAEDLRLAATSLGRLTGRLDVEDVLDQIFSRFCIGK